MRIGVDSYAYHRLLGEVRPGERSPGRAPYAGSADVVAEARRLGLDAVSLETVFLPAPAPGVLHGLIDPGGPEILLAHGHPEGVAYGRDETAIDDLLAWLDVAAHDGIRLVRVVAAGPRLRSLHTSEERVAGTVAALRRAADQVAGTGIRLAIENHADLDVGEIEQIIRGVGADRLGVCLDTTNAVRVGDDPVAVALRLAEHVDAVHVKDHVRSPDDAITGPRSVPFGTGEAGVASVLDAVLARRPDAVCLVEIGHLGPDEVDEVALVEDGVAWLRAYGERRTVRR